MIRIIILSFLMLNPCYKSIAQTTLDWIALSDIELTERMSEEFGTSYEEASFSKHIMALDSAEVIISGYMIPLDALGTSYALSRNPNASCFFCGKAGPETVIRLWFEPKHMKRYDTDKHLRIQGQLRVHSSTKHGFLYELWNSKPI